MDYKEGGSVLATAKWLPRVLFPWAPKSLQTVTAAMKLKDACSLEGRL